MIQPSFLHKSIGQIGYVVEDVEKIIKNYYEKFGIDGWKIYTYGPNILSFMHYRGKPTQYKSRIALGYFGDTRIELIQPLEGHTIYTDYIAAHGYGVQHLGIYVQNIQEAITEAEEAGISVVMDGGGFGLDGDGYYAYLDTEEKYGITYELIQRPAKRREPEAIFP